jgi:SAM-dependent methyltransferase
MDQSEFSTQIEFRGAGEYAEFFLRALPAHCVILDCGCGIGSITVGLAADQTTPRLTVGLDHEYTQFHAAVDYSEARRISCLRFVAGDAYHLPFRDCSFEAVLAHSILEAVSEPVALLREVHRVLKPGGIVGAASVEYGGLIVPPDPSGLLHEFYETRERLWIASGIGFPRRGRELRSLLTGSGFQGVSASSRYVSYGTADAVKRFSADRSRECQNSDFVEGVLLYKLASSAMLKKMADAWMAWSTDPAAFLAFAWCNALGWKHLATSSAS